MITVADICHAIEEFAPLALQEGYDNAGLQVGDPQARVTAVMLCLDVTAEVLAEAKRRKCNMVVSHHPFIFHGLKSLVGADETQRLVIDALKSGIAVYSAHTNLDAAWGGVSHEMAHMLGVTELEVLEPTHRGKESGDKAEGLPLSPTGIGVVGNIRPTPKLEFLRRIKEKFNVRALKYSSQSPALVIKRVAICGGSGSSLIKDALKAGADLYITGDVKYHDFATYGLEMVIADIGHYEGELCSMKILSRIMRQHYPDLVVYFSDDQQNPIAVL